MTRKNELPMFFDKNILLRIHTFKTNTGTIMNYMLTLKEKKSLIYSKEVN